MKLLLTKSIIFFLLISCFSIKVAANKIEGIYKIELGGINIGKIVEMPGGRNSQAGINSSLGLRLEFSGRDSQAEIPGRNSQAGICPGRDSPRPKSIQNSSLGKSQPQA